MCRAEQTGVKGSAAAELPSPGSARHGRDVRRPSWKGRWVEQRASAGRFQSTRRARSTPACAERTELGTVSGIRCAAQAICRRLPAVHSPPYGEGEVSRGAGQRLVVLCAPGGPGLFGPAAAGGRIRGPPFDLPAGGARDSLYREASLAIGSLVSAACRRSSWRIAPGCERCASRDSGCHLGDAPGVARHLSESRCGSAASLWCASGVVVHPGGWGRWRAEMHWRGAEGTYGREGR